MQNYERKLGNKGYGTYGKGHFLETLPVPQDITFDSFAGGLDMRDSREDTPPNSSPNSLDVEVTLKDRIRPVAGTTTLEVLTRDSTQVVLQASLDYTSELVLFDAPFIGVKSSTTTEWTDVSLPAADRPFASVNFGGALLFSNGRTGLYVREAGESEVLLVDGGPAAHTFASFAGRVFAGASVIGGNREPLGISWSAASSDYMAWAQFDEEGAITGAGSELLIDDMVQGNYIVALRTMGLDFLAIFLRNSIWIGRRTQQFNRPADFQPRVTGIGAVSETTCTVTRFGVLHLHDTGVYLFDGNNTNLVSEQINSELLPLDKENIHLYKSTYNPLTKNYFLFTPVCTWVYDLEKQRWHKRSIVAAGASLFAPQIPAVLWGELTGTWADQTETWEEYKATETNDLNFVFLGTEDDDTVLAKEDRASRSNFGVEMTPYWETGLAQIGPLNQLNSVKGVILDYVGGGSLALFSPDNNNVYVERQTISCAYDTADRTRSVFCEWTGKGVGLRIYFELGTIEISRLQIRYLARGPRIESKIPTFALVEVTSGDAPIIETFDSLVTGSVPAGWTALDNAAAQETFTIVDFGGTEGKGLRLAANYVGGSGSTDFVVGWTGGPSAAAGETFDVLALVRPSLQFQSAPILVRALFVNPNWRALGAGTSNTSGGEGTTITTHMKAQVMADANSLSPVGTAAAFDWFTVPGWRYLRVQGYGTRSVRAKGWKVGETEPVAWMIDRTDNGYVGPYSGILAVHLRASLSNLTQTDVAYLSVVIGTSFTDVTVTGIPDGWKAQLSGGTAVSETDGTAILSLSSPHASAAALLLLNELNQTVASIDGPIWGGSTYAYEET